MKIFIIKFFVYLVLVVIIHYLNKKR